MERYLSTQDAAHILGVTDTAVRLMVQRGELPVAGETASGIRLFRPDVVRKLPTERHAQGKRSRHNDRIAPGQEVAS